MGQLPARECGKKVKTGQRRRKVRPCPMRFYLTVTVTALVWLSEPEVPVTISVAAAVAGVVVGGVIDLLPPQPRANSEVKSSKPNRLTHPMLLRVRRFFFRVVRTVPSRPSPGSRAATPGALYPVGGGVELAEIVKVAAGAPGAMAAGLKEHVKPDGAEQVSEI